MKKYLQSLCQVVFLRAPQRWYFWFCIKAKAWLASIATKWLNSLRGLLIRCGARENSPRSGHSGEVKNQQSSLPFVYCFINPHILTMLHSPLLYFCETTSSEKNFYDNYSGEVYVVVEKMLIHYHKKNVKEACRAEKDLSSLYVDGWNLINGSKRF